MIQVKVFDEDHEQVLEKEVNRFLKKVDEDDLIDIKYQVECFVDENDDDYYRYTAMIIYRA
ncbi:sporulation protein Cse60 [Sutcliffiella cohnii]|uniref:Sporulation protein cse60 n=1 Tax=Sutcliffiella cohnii TaxID=33932 RepID=A0A223KU09_9BACI|nr:MULTISPECIES: sporulation protein Cse60 [Sutcliffiella]AST92926.1 sporulation protein cse60 [Sutcliffiella cohnii]MED4016113.1 sporulation protein Cse60 [Sutcliffiella cohnii]WBL14187.1 sporulation protein Cse60 [Sutcliffiella sp. NC1]